MPEWQADLLEVEHEENLNRLVLVLALGLALAIALPLTLALGLALVFGLVPTLEHVFALAVGVGILLLEYFRK